MKNFLDLPISTKVNCVLLHAIFLMLRLMITKLLGVSNAEGITVVGSLVYGGAICKWGRMCELLWVLLSEGVDVIDVAMDIAAAFIDLVEL